MCSASALENPLLDFPKVGRSQELQNSVREPSIAQKALYGCITRLFPFPLSLLLGPPQRLRCFAAQLQPSLDFALPPPDTSIALHKLRILFFHLMQPLQAFPVV